MHDLEIKWQRLHPEAKPPSLESNGAAGFDLSSTESVTIESGGTMVIPTGLRIKIPAGWEGQVRSRSGLSIKGLVVTNSPGTIDSDYRGEIKVILTNQSDEPFTVNSGDRIAQMVFNEVPIVVFTEATIDPNETERATGGFGSTGVK